MTPLNGPERIEPPSPEKGNDVQQQFSEFNEKKRTDTQQAFVRKLDQSDIASELKEIADVWLQHNLRGEAASAYLDAVKEKGRTASVSQLLEFVGDCYLANRPDVSEQFRKREISAPVLFDKILDHVFDTVLENVAEPQEKSRIQNVIRRYKTLVSNV